MAAACRVDSEATSPEPRHAIEQPVAPAATDCSRFPTGPADFSEAIPGWETSRPMVVHLPPGYDCQVATPVVIALHGALGDSTDLLRATCPNGDVTHANCLNNVADRHGFVVAYGNGTGAPFFPNSRTWHAGGTARTDDVWACLSGTACETAHVDDVAYVADLLQHLADIVAVDSQRVFVTGLSNGGVLSHRLACRLADRIAAIAPVAGPNQHSTTQPCTAARGIPVLFISGDADPVSPYDSETTNDPGARTNGLGRGIPQSVAGWVAHDACNPNPAADTFDTDASDGTSVERDLYSGCRDGAEVLLYRVIGGGHTWPGGWQYAGVSSVGRVSNEFVAGEVIWDFFSRHPLP